MEALLACYYPTTTFLVDDNYNFLQNLAFSLGFEQTSFKLFDRPQHALAYFEQDYIRPISPTISLSALHQEIYNAKRFAQISTVIVDHSMPGLTGLELAEQIHQLPLQIVLLTGEVQGKNLVQSAHNTIQHFIYKEAFDFSTQLMHVLHQSQQAFFQRLSATLIAPIVAQMKQQNTHCCLTDPIFIDYFHDIIKTHTICEYYLTESLGSYLCLNAAGEASRLIVKSEPEIDNAMKIGDYYCSYLKPSTDIEIHFENIKSYNSYLNSIF
jgi:CheY-like chemotaxis protein